jgi:hypothetical protein
MDTTITVQFPRPIYRRLQRQAQVLERPIGEIVVKTVEHGLPMWLNTFPVEYEQELAKLQNLDSLRLQKIAESKLSETKQRKLSKLLQKNSEGTISAKELEELDNLHLEVDFLTLKKAQALVLLKERGHGRPISNAKGKRR